MKHKWTAVWLAACALGCGMPTLSAADAAAVQVAYDPPRLSVEAADAGLLEVLTAIGAKVGFTVVPSGRPSAPVTVSMVDVRVEDALRQLLRAENHTIIYRQGTSDPAMVDRIVLLGPPGPADPAPAVASQSPSAVVAPQPGTPVPPVAQQDVVPSAAVPGGDAAQPTAGQEPVTVGDMLRSQALGSVAAQPGAPQAVAPEASAQGAQDLEQSLAITTRRAQQGLSSLVESLQRATEALQQQQPVATTPGH